MNAKTPKLGPQCVLRTNKLSKPHYFAGMQEGNIGLSVVLANNIFDAWVFPEGTEAADVKDQLDADDWVVSEISAPQMSPALKKAMEESGL